MKAVCFFIKTLLIYSALFGNSASAGGVVCHYDSTDINIKKNYTAEISFYKDFEILSEEGLEYAEFAIPINEYIEFHNLKGYTELPGGKKIKIGEKSYMILTGRMDREFGGKRAVLISLKSPVIGAKLHYEYHLKIKSLLYLPQIVRQNSFAVDRMVVRVRWPKRITPFYDFSGFETKKKKRSVRFFAEDLPELNNEPNSCRDSLYLFIGTRAFKFDNHKYRCESWSDVGAFYDRLTSQPGFSIREARQLASELLAGAQTKTDSAASLFDFVSDSVSYVSFRIGTGDFKPHRCDDIIERRFGDCKDQSILLSSLFRSAGFESNTALISTISYPHGDLLNPWPTYFDHAVVLVKTGNGELMLDPSDPFSTPDNLPWRLRGKYYLSADGVSGLQVTPSGPGPDEVYSWNFDLSEDSAGTPSLDFAVYYGNRAAEKFYALYSGNGSRDDEYTIASIQNGGWAVSGFESVTKDVFPDSISMAGKLNIDRSDYYLSDDFSVGSPMLAYLLENIFNLVRENSYCGDGTIRMEEYVRLRNLSRVSRDTPEYSEFWTREGLEFYDEMEYIENGSVFKRVFEFTGPEISREDFNAFRNYLLSQKNQRYVQLQD